MPQEFRDFNENCRVIDCTEFRLSNLQTSPSEFTSILIIQSVPELADQTYSAFSLVITESNVV
jgi:hypothetical protein